MWFDVFGRHPFLFFRRGFNIFHGNISLDTKQSLILRLEAILLDLRHGKGLIPSTLTDSNK
jgi:hypothetical protein